MSAEPYFKMTCDHCWGHIEYPSSDAGEIIACPHCGRQTRLLYVPTQSPAKHADFSAAQKPAQNVPSKLRKRVFMALWASAAVVFMGVGIHAFNRLWSFISAEQEAPLTLFTTFIVCGVLFVFCLAGVGVPSKSRKLFFMALWISAAVVFMGVGYNAILSFSEPDASFGQFMIFCVCCFLVIFCIAMGFPFILTQWSTQRGKEPAPKEGWHQNSHPRTVTGKAVWDVVCVICFIACIVGWVFFRISPLHAGRQDYRAAHDLIVNQTSGQPYYASIENYLKANANDPSSVSIVSMGSPVNDTRWHEARGPTPVIITNGKVSFGNMGSAAGYSSKGTAQVSCTFRAKNGFGALVLETDTFVIDVNNNVINTLPNQ